VKCNKYLECEIESFLNYIDIRSFDDEDLDKMCNEKVSFHQISFFVIFFSVLGFVALMLIIAWLIFRRKFNNPEEERLNINKTKDSMATEV